MGAPVIAKKYNLLRRLGHGGMAEVFLARQEGLRGFQKLVVVKRILPHLAQDGEFVTMFLDEARTAADLRHPNIINVQDINRNDGTYYMAMEFVHGQDVRRLQRKVSKSKDPFPIEHACEIISSAAAGLHYAHTKVGLNGIPLEIVHRDVSPQNILVAYTGETKIVDFGIAKAASQSQETEIGVIKGKYAYMSPEQAQGGHLDALTDQFALGVVFWELLTLRRLFKRNSEAQTLQAVIQGTIPDPRRFREDCPPEIARVVMKMLERKRTKRYDDCEEMLTDLEDATAKLGIARSQARLGKWMRALYNDEIEDEQALSAERLDETAQSAASLPRVETRRLETNAKDDDATTQEGHRRSKRSQTDATRSSRQRKRTQAPLRSVAPSTSQRTRTRVPTGGETEIVSPMTQHLSRHSRTYLFAGAAVVGLLGLIAAALFFLLRADSGIVIRSKPSGARIFIAGQDSGHITPHVLKGDAGETVQVRLVKDSRTIEKTVVIPKGNSSEVVIELPK